MKEPQKWVETEGLDLAMFGQRLKHARRAKGLTLADLGAKVGRTPSVLSLIENGKREPRLSLVETLAPARIYLKQEPVGAHSPRAVILQSLGHFLLGHGTPKDYADFLRQRVEANYFAAAMLIPERAAVPFLRAAKERRDLAVEDLVDVFSVSYEMAAHRVTNLVTHHLDVPCHFVKNDASGVIYKAYQNDGVVFPADATGAIEG